MLPIATQIDQNDTSASIICEIDKKVKATRDIVAEWVHLGYRTDDPFTLTDDPFKLSENTLRGTGTFASTGLKNTEIKAPDINREETALFEKFEQKIFHKLRFPKHWVNEGISQPHTAAKEKCLAICKKLFKEKLLIPDLILPTKEEGMFLSYDKITPDFDRTMIIEIYNSLETALIICDNVDKNTFYNEDISELDFSRAVAAFKG